LHKVKGKGTVSH